MATVRIGQGAIDVSATAGTPWEAHIEAMRLFRRARRLEDARRAEMAFDNAVEQEEEEDNNGQA